MCKVVDGAPALLIQYSMKLYLLMKPSTISSSSIGTPLKMTMMAM